MKILRDGTTVVQDGNIISWTTPEGIKKVGFILKKEAGIAIIQTIDDIVTLDLEEI